MKISGSRIEQTQMARTVICFFLGVFCSPLTSIFFDRNIWKRASLASRLNVAASSGELRHSIHSRGFWQIGTTGTLFVVRRASGVCEARLGDSSTNSLVNFFGLKETGTGEAGPETRGLSTKDSRIASRSADCSGGFGDLPNGMTGFPCFPFTTVNWRSRRRFVAIPIDEGLLLLDKDRCG